MSDLGDRFDRAQRMPAPDLWNEIESRPPGPPPHSPRRPFVVAVGLGLTLALIAGGIGLVRRGGLNPGSDSTPAPSVGGRPTRELGRYSFVPQILRSESETGMVIEAPEGRVRWTVGASCSIEGEPVDGSIGGGGFGGGCPEDALVGWAGGVAALGVAGDVYLVFAGRAIPEQGSRIRAVLADGRSTTLTPRNGGLWFVVLGPMGDGYNWPDRDSRLVRLERLDAEGDVEITIDLSEDWEL